MSRATLQRDPGDVASMFDAVADGYDRTNTVISFGQDRVWRAAVARALALRPGDRVLDLAAGTATSSVPFARAGAQVVACDFSLGMLRVGAQRLGGARVPVGQGRIHLVAGDALRLPFAEGAFDRVSVSFGLRNVANLDAGLRELLRVTRPGGRLVVCETSTPPFPPLRAAYRTAVLRVLPLLARRVSSDPEAYEYLTESIRTWPEQEPLARRIAEAGWTDVAWRNLSLGTVALHRARRPG